MAGDRESPAKTGTQSDSGIAHCDERWRPGNGRYDGARAGPRGAAQLVWHRGAGSGAWSRPTGHGPV